MKFAVKLTTPVQSPVVPELRVNVVYTRLPGNPKALQTANALAHGLGARITVHLAREIPYPLALKSPPVAVEFTEEKLRRLASGQPVDTTIQVYLCRDLTETVRRALPPESVVVIGGSKRWWPTRERSLARALRRDGHHVILTHAD